MAKQRMIAGFVMKMEGVHVPGDPIKTVVTLPEHAEIKSYNIDVQGNFVAFAEVWSHPEGTQVRHQDVEILIMSTSKVLPVGNWVYQQTLQAGAAVFHLFRKERPKVVT